MLVVIVDSVLLWRGAARGASAKFGARRGQRHRALRDDARPAAAPRLRLPQAPGASAGALRRLTGGSRRPNVAAMEYRFLGRSGLKISELTYGNWITHGSQVENDVATACVRAALDAGITTFDTADVYANTAAEEVLGAALAGRAARGPGDLHQGLLADRPGRPERLGPVAQAHPGVDQRLAAAAADRLRRPLPGPPLRPRDAARGDDAGVRRRRPGRQGALHRRQRVDGGADPRRRTRWPRSSASTWCRASRSTRCSGGSSRPRSCRPAASWASRRSSGRRSRRAC